MILVTGATGTTGHAAVQALIEAGQPVRAMVRRAEHASRFAAGVDVVVADMRDAASLPRAMAGIEQMLLISPLEHALPELQARMAQAARAAGVARIVKVSTQIADPQSSDPIGRWHGAAERAVESTGARWFHLRPCNFMQNLLTFAPDIGGSGSFWAPMQDARISLVDARDVGAAAAAVLSDVALPDGHAVITGSDRPTYAEFASIAAQAIGRPVRYENVAGDEARRRFVAGGMPEWKADALVGMYAFLQDPATTRLSDDFTRLTGRPPRRLADFVDEHRQAFAEGKPAH